MRVLAIDPGPEFSAWLLLRDGQPSAFSKDINDQVLSTVAGLDADVCAIEMVASYGMAVGREVFETCVWAGRFTQARYNALYDIVHPVYRRDVKLHLCGSARAKDANVRQALIDRYGPGKERAIGRKATPGPLYGLTGDCWAALGVAVTVADGMAQEAAA